MLHHSEYRAKYAENLKRELPRIPLVGCAAGALECGSDSYRFSVPAAGHHPPRKAAAGATAVQSASRRPAEVFWAFTKAGKQLADLHITYEKLEPYKLKFLENKDVPLSYKVGQPDEHGHVTMPKMRVSKDRKSLKVNDSLTLAGIPPETFDYRLGNRSAFEWVIDQYQVTEDKHSGIRSDPNRPDDPEYIVRLVGQVIRVSLETVKIVDSLPSL